MEALRVAFGAGAHAGTAAVLAGVSLRTAHRFFKRFRAAGFARGVVAPRTSPRRKHRFVSLFDRAPPHYTGPEWIGRRIAPPL